MKYATRQALRLFALLTFALACGALLVLGLASCTLVWIRGDCNTINDTGGPNLQPASRTPITDLINEHTKH
jgi:hypothetical protein